MAPNKRTDVQPNAKPVPSLAKRALRIFLTVVAVIVVFGTLFLVYIGVTIGKDIDKSLNAIETRQDKARQSYEKIVLPTGLTESQRRKFGDALDSPDSVGWTYISLESDSARSIRIDAFQFRIGRLYHPKSLYPGRNKNPSI